MTASCALECLFALRGQMTNETGLVCGKHAVNAGCDGCALRNDDYHAR